MELKERSFLDEFTVTVNGESKTLREHIVAEEGKSLSQQFMQAIGRFSLYRSSVSSRKAHHRDGVIYSRSLTPAEIDKEEVKIMASQSLKIMEFLVANPKQWYKPRDILGAVDLNPITAGPTASRVIQFFQEKEPDMLKVRLTTGEGKRKGREIFFVAHAGDVKGEAELLNKRYLEWMTDMRNAKAGKQPKGATPPDVGGEEATPSDLRKIKEEIENTFSKVVGERKLQVDVNISVRFGLL